MDFNDIHKGSVIMFQGEPNKVIEYQPVKPGKGTSYARTKLRGLKTGRIVEYAFKAGEKIELAKVLYLDGQYLYKENNQYCFMLNDTYEQYYLSQEVIGERAKFFKEGMETKLVLHDNIPIDVSIPIKLEFKVTSAPPSVKGNTATNATKQVTIETGAIVNVPLFVKEGDVVRINTETGEYDSRV